VFGYIGMPVLLLLFMRGEKIASFHISLQNFFKPPVDLRGAVPLHLAMVL